MPLTPVEIRHLELHRAWLRGYRKSTVDDVRTDLVGDVPGWRVGVGRRGHGPRVRDLGRAAARPRPGR